MGGQDTPKSRHQWLLHDQLTDERAKKNSFEQRGIAIISTSGTLVTLVMGFITLAARSQEFALPRAALWLLVSALAGLVIASTLGLLINLPAPTPVIDAHQLAEVADQIDWDTTDDESRRADHRLQADLLIKLRKVNRIRSGLLFLALLVEVLSLVLIAASGGVAIRPLL